MKIWLLLSLLLFSALISCKDGGSLSLQYLDGGKPQDRKINAIDEKSGCAAPVLKGDLLEQYRAIHSCSNGEYRRIDFKERFNDRYENKTSPESLVVSLFLNEEVFRKKAFEIPADSLPLFMTISNVAGGIWVPKEGFVRLNSMSVDINVHWVPVSPGAEAGELKTSSAISLRPKK